MGAANGKGKRKEDEEEGIAYILKALNGFQAYFSSAAPTPSPINGPDKLNDYVYELCKPSGRPSVEIVFFHGFELGRSSETYATTWLSRDYSELWPNWIRESVPEVRILLVSYDASATKKGDRGCTDMYVTRENLVQSLTDNDAQVGQDGCPVVLVGHSLGGLVIKEILLQANQVLSLDNPERPNLRMKSFLENVKHVFYYSCPHNGTKLADDKTMLPKGPLFELLTTLNKEAARRNEAFRQLRVKCKWRASSIGELLPTDLGSLGRKVVIVEGSARHDTDVFYTAHADHFSICKPASRSDASFSKLMDVIHCTIGEDVQGHKITVSATSVGLDDQINQIKRRLRTTKGLGICGIGGIGKSTLAKAVYNAISGEFEYTSFVSEVKRLVGEKVSIEGLQAEILKELYYKGRKCEATSEARWNRLKGRKVLIILDDVEYESQVFVMPETDRGVGFFSDESRVLVTSRNKRICSSKDFAVHDAEFLGKEASRKLFCSHAFKEEHAPRPYEDHVEKFVKKCGGLPLALEVAGKFLYTRRDEAMWNGAFQRLSAAKPLCERRTDALWSIFEVIYEDLQEEEQQMFLDIATCFHGDKREMAERVWHGCDWVTTADMGWQNLVDIGFVKTTGYMQTIWMHELLRDFGWMKANPGSIESYSRVCCYQDNGKPPPWPFKEGTTPKVKFLKIVYQPWYKLGDQLRDSLSIDIERLRGLENLKVLLLNGVSLFGAFNLLPDNLQVLMVEKCGWTARSSKSISDAVDHYNIPRDGWCSTLGESSAPKSGQHVSLRYMDFRKCHHYRLEQDLFPDDLFPDHSFEHLPALKYLAITGEFKEAIQLPDSLGELSALETLRIINVLSISLPETLGKLSELKQLYIEDATLTRLPDSLGQLQGLQKLDVRGEALTCLPDSLGQLQGLQKLDVSGGALTCLPDSLGQLQGLQKLDVRGEAMTCLPDSLGQLQGLQKLGVRGQALTCLPDSLGQLQGLQKLDIYCQALTCLPDSLGQLQGLQKLIIYCHTLTCLPDSLGQLQGLQKLIIYCNTLTCLPDSLGQLQSLRQLQIGCKILTRLPDSLGQLKGLQELVVLGGTLTHLPDSIGQLGRLELLVISSCDGLTALPDTLGQLHGLRNLRIRRCKGLTSLPDNLGHLGGLQRLAITECEGLKTLPHALGDLHALQYIEVAGCGNLEGLPDTVTKLHCVQIFRK